MTFRVAAGILCAGLALLLTAPAGPVAAQGRTSWSWPERAENLRVLPEDLPAPQLRAVMQGFTRSLGVRCSHCHVGEPGQPLSTYDFPSDENPNKDVAREMLRMLDSIDEHLRAIEPSGEERVNMWCHTCHRGRPRPMTLIEELTEAHTEGGAAAALERYGALREGFLIAGAYDFREPALNQFGYQLMQGGDVEGAIAVFRVNLDQFPESANAHDSLAEAHMTAGDREAAIEHYRKSLELDPENENAARRREELGVDGN